MKTVSLISAVFSFIFFTATSYAEMKLSLNENSSINISLMGQLWTVYSTELKIPGYTAEKNRTDMFLRRGRISFKGQINNQLRYTLVFAYDNVGKQEPNPVSVAKGSIKTETTYSKIELWDAFFVWSPYRDLLNISFGYFRPQVGKESITSGFTVVSFEKGLPNFYVRRHFTGKPDSGSGFGSTNGRVFLLNIGGLYSTGKVWVNWNFGVGDNQNFTDSQVWSPLFAGRVAVSLFEPEMEKYSLGYTQTFYGQRNGITFGFNYGYQEKGIEKTITGRPQFKNNQVIGGDFFAGFMGFELTGEYDILKRDWTDGSGYTDRVWQLKADYSFRLKNGRVLQPSISYSRFSPDGNGSSIYSRKKNEWWDAGVNYYINRQKLKITLHYASGKIYNYNGGTAKSSYIGLGFQFKL